MFTRIAVPLDGSAFGDCAIAYAASLARRSRASLELLHVHLTYMPGARLEALPQYRFNEIVAADETADAAAREEELERLEEIAGLLSAKDGITATGHVLRGKPAEALTEHVRAAGADLIVMATRAEGGAMYARFRSISDALVRNTGIPVLLVQPGTGGLVPTDDLPLRRMLIPVDGSAFSEAILDAAAEVARLMAAEVELLYVAAPADGYLLPPRVTGAEARSAFEYLDVVAARFPPELAAPHLRILHHEEPARAILEELRAGSYDLVAMASHGRGGMRPLLLGSTADQVLRASRTPILLVCPYADARLRREAEQAIPLAVG